MTVTATNGGSGALARVNTQSFLRAGANPRRGIVQVRSSGAIYTTKPTTRSVSLIPLGAVAARQFRVAVQDYNGLWSEWSDQVSYTPPGAFSAGSAHAAFASATESEILLEEPGIAFPDLSLGSGMMQTYRTSTGGGLGDEQRRGDWGPRTSFLCVLNDLDEDQSLLLQQFFRQLNGGWRPFHFEFIHPVTDEMKRYTVRFQDPSLAESMFDGSRSRFSFTLVEVVDGQRGEDL